MGCCGGRGVDSLRWLVNRGITVLSPIAFLNAEFALPSFSIASWHSNGGNSLDRAAAACRCIREVAPVCTHLIGLGLHGTLGPLQLDRFIRFCKAHWCAQAQLTDRHTVWDNAIRHDVCIAIAHIENSLQCCGDVDWLNSSSSSINSYSL